MNIVHKAAIAASLALATLFAVLPANAYPHPYRHANGLDRQANHAAMNGNLGRAARLRRQAGRIRRRTYARHHTYYHTYRHAYRHMY